MVVSVWPLTRCHQQTRLEVSGARDGAGHRAALGLAAPTCLGADPAVLVFSRMPLALLGTGRAGISTQATEMRRQRSAASHDPHRRRARLGAITVKADAERHLGHALVETRIAAHLARNEAFDACLEACVILLIVRPEERRQLDCGHEKTSREVELSVQELLQPAFMRLGHERLPTVQAGIVVDASCIEF